MFRPPFLHKRRWWADLLPPWGVQTSINTLGFGYYINICLKKIGLRLVFHDSDSFKAIMSSLSIIWRKAIKVDNLFLTCLRSCALKKQTLTVFINLKKWRYFFCWVQEVLKGLDLRSFSTFYRSRFQSTNTNLSKMYKFYVVNIPWNHFLCVLLLESLR